MKRYVIVGNGVAGTTAVEQIRKIDQEGEIVLLTEEDLPFIPESGSSTTWGVIWTRRVWCSGPRSGTRSGA